MNGIKTEKNNEKPFDNVRFFHNIPSFIANWEKDRNDPFSFLFFIAIILLYELNYSNKKCSTWQSILEWLSKKLIYREKFNRCKWIIGVFMKKATNESEVIFLFAKIHEKLGFEKILKLRQKFPDCIAKKEGKTVKIEFEYNASGFLRDKHNSKKCDYLICWNDDLKGNKKVNHIIELTKCSINSRTLYKETSLWGLDNIECTKLSKKRLNILNNFKKSPPKIIELKDWFKCK